MLEAVAAKQEYPTLLVLVNVRSGVRQVSEGRFMRIDKISVTNKAFDGSWFALLCDD